MKRTEIESNLGSCIRRGRGFLFDGKRYSSVEYRENFIRIWSRDYKYFADLKYEEITEIKMETVEGNCERVIFGTEYVW